MRPQVARFILTGKLRARELGQRAKIEPVYGQPDAVQENESGDGDKGYHLRMSAGLAARAA